jgi:hypothetical protein
MEVAADHHVIEVKAKHNSAPSERWRPYVFDFKRLMGWDRDEQTPASGALCLAAALTPLWRRSSPTFRSWSISMRRHSM